MMSTQTDVVPNVEWIDGKQGVGSTVIQDWFSL